ncbi:MAG TPA: pyruvate, water dikinase regulatory protein, partial [Rhodospirillales bacterium]|nr:pyruvate, water dikinase regulatory protein [Rhodospirillales bacterium]
RASLVQFEKVQMTEHIWPMVRGRNQVREVVAGIKCHPGFVLYTLVDPDMRKILEEGCRRLQVPSISMLDPIVTALGAYLGAEVHARPGRQHIMDADYFGRIEAMHFVLNHDDGQLTRDLNEADVVVIGVSRTSKTPTCIYLANRGIKAANIPVVPGFPLPPEVLEAEKPLIVGLTEDPKRLVEIRRNRLRMLKQDEQTDYVDSETVFQEVNAARRLFASHGWPVIDVTRRSIEETAAHILQLYNRRQEQNP